MKLDSGILSVYRGENKAEPGSKPKMVYTLIWKSYFGFKTVGVSRFYSAKRAGDRADYLVETPRIYAVSAATDKVILTPFSFNDKKAVYSISQIQHIEDEEGLPATNFTLERMDELDAEQIEGSACLNMGACLSL